MDEKEFKKVLKIHGYLLSDEESSSDSSDPSEELDEIYQLYKPRPVQIDPKKDKIIIIGSQENYLDAVKEKFELDLHTKELVNRGEKKLTKNQRRRLNRRLRKSTEFLDKIIHINEDDLYHDDNDIPLCDNSSIEETKNNGVKKKKKKNSILNHVASTESILSEFSEACNLDTDIVEFNDVPDSEETKDELTENTNKKKKKRRKKKKKGISDDSSVLNHVASTESILSEFIEDCNSDNFVEVAEPKNDILPEVPTGAKKKTKRRKRSKKKKPTVEEAPQSIERLLTNLHNSISNNTSNSFRIHLHVQEILKFLTRTETQIPPTIRCVCKIIIEVSFEYQMFLKNFENPSDDSIKLLFFNIDTIILRNTQNCEFTWSLQNYFEYCGLICVLIRLLEKIAVDLMSSGVKNQNLINFDNSFDVIQKCGEFNLKNLGTSILSCRANNCGVTLKFSVIEGVIKRRLEKLEQEVVLDR